MLFPLTCHLVPEQRLGVTGPARGRAGRLKAVSSWRTRGDADLANWRAWRNHGEGGSLRDPQVHVCGSDPKQHPSDFDTSGQTTQISRLAPGWH